MTITRTEPFRITVYLDGAPGGQQGWMTDTTDPAVRELFGTSILPTPFLAGTPLTQVMETIRELNPECDVVCPRFHVYPLASFRGLHRSQLCPEGTFHTLDEAFDCARIDRPYRVVVVDSDGREYASTN